MQPPLLPLRGGQAGVSVWVRTVETTVRLPVYHPYRQMVDRLKKNPWLQGVELHVVDSIVLIYVCQCL